MLLNHWRMKRERALTAIFLLPVFLLIISGCGKKESLNRITSEEAILPPQFLPVDSSKIRKGLLPFYFKKMNIRHVDQLPNLSEAQVKGIPGDPVLSINHKFGQGMVFDSGVSQKVGILFTGYIRLSKVGRYVFKARANDGVRIWIGNKMVVDDPGVHSDRFSKEGFVENTELKWQFVLIKYFQRKGTATLQLYWKPPGSNDFTIIPETAFGHLSNSGR